MFKKNKESLSLSLKNNKAFTIVELLIVIVIIGILAAITIVSYSGITKKANGVTFVSDLATAKKQFALYYADHGVYPTGLNGNNCPTNASVTPVDTNYCLKSSSGSVFAIPSSNNMSYTLTATKGALVYSVTNDSSPIATSNGLTNCPTGFVLVPGSSTYSTSNFCVMKYEAKADDNGDGVGDTTYDGGYGTWQTGTYPISASRKLVSSAAGYPVGYISRDTAITAASNFTKDCTGCHLISEAEWMTIAQNVLGVGSNWSSGTVGNGFIYSGHSDTAPDIRLTASTNDSDGYYGTGQTTGSSQRRTLTLSNGNVVWDLAGNMFEITSGKMSPTIQPGVSGAGYHWLEWSAVTIPGSLPVDPTPAGTGISGASSWRSTNGIGQLVSDTTLAADYAFARGGGVQTPGSSGVLFLSFMRIANSEHNEYGFRVTAPAF